MTSINQISNDLQTVRREQSQIRVADFINNFDPNDRSGMSESIYRIPAHQRFPNWSKKQKSRFIDSIMKNYPIHQFILSKIFLYHETGLVKATVFDIEDGETRANILVEYKADKFEWYPDEYNTNEGFKYSQLEGLQEKFDNYMMPVDKIDCDTDLSKRREICYRLNCGTPMCDNDRFWLASADSLPSFVISQFQPTGDVHSLERFDKYFGPTNWSKAKRPKLGDYYGAVAGILYGSEFINSSFNRQGPKMTVSFSEVEAVEKITAVYERWFNILDESYNTKPEPEQNPKKLRRKILSLKSFSLSNLLGLYIHDYTMSTTDQRRSIHRRWVKYLTLYRLSKEFKKTFWNGLHGNARNNTPDAFDDRLKRFREFAQAKESNSLKKFCTDHGIKTILDNASDNNDSDDNSSDEDEN